MNHSNKNSSFMYYSMPLSNAGSINSEPIDPFHRRQPYYKSSAAIMSV